MNESTVNTVVPYHVAIIMDGNGRWAKARLLPRSAGHKAGMERMIKLLEHAFDRGVHTVTVYALSTENLSRPKEEVSALFSLFRSYFSTYVKRIVDRNCRLKVLGDVTALPEDIQGLIAQAEKDSASGEKGDVNIALNYGARQELVRAVKSMIEQGVPVTEESLSANLYTAGQRDPDLIIRTGKEKRLSNFLLYQAAYAELYYSDKMFPDFSEADLDEAFSDFATRQRRYGKV